MSFPRKDLNLFSLLPLWREAQQEAAGRPAALWKDVHHIFYFYRHLH